MFQFSRQHEFTKDRRLRMLNLGTVEYRVDGGSWYAGLDRVEWTSLPSLSPNSKGSLDRKNRVSAPVTAQLFLIPDQPDEGYSVVLYGTGVGRGVEPRFTDVVGMSGSPRLEKDLRKHGLKPDHVDVVVLPGLNFLCGSNLITQSNRGDKAASFPEAEYVVHEAEVRQAEAENGLTSGVFMGIKRDFKVLRSKGQVFEISGNEPHQLSPYIEVLPHGGVTAGYCSMLARYGSESMLVSPLLFPTPNHLRPDVQLGMSLNRLEVYHQKTRVLDRLWRDRTLLFFPYCPTRSVAYVTKSKSGEYDVERVSDFAF